MSTDDSQSKHPTEPSQQPRRHRIHRWTVVVPVLTLLVFGGLCLLTFLEVDWRRIQEAVPSLAPRKVSQEALARYRAEAKKLGELRAEKRAGLTVEGLLEAFRPKPDGTARPLPWEAMLLSDFQALRKRSEQNVPALLRSIVPLWKQALLSEKTPKGGLALLETLFLQAAVSLEAAPKLSPAERSAVFDLAREVLRRREEALGAVIVYLRQIAEESDVSALNELAEAARSAQHRLEIQKIVDRLQGGSKSPRVAHAL